MHLSIPQPVSYSEIPIPEGKAGAIATLKIMRVLAKQYRRHPDIIEIARNVLRGVPRKEWIEEIRALLYFVRESIRYTLDPNEVETLATPTRLLEIGMGDCDDMALLLASMLEATGHPARFVAVGRNAGELCHVYVETLVGRSWLALDPTEPYDVGWHAPDMAERYVVHL